MNASVATTHSRSSTIARLDYRENDGIAVSLLWSRVDISLSVLVVDAKANEQFEISVQPAEAMTVFRHPFAYGATRRLQPLLGRA